MEGAMMPRRRFVKLISGASASLFFPPLLEKALSATIGKLAIDEAKAYLLKQKMPRAEVRELFSDKRLSYPFSPSGQRRARSYEEYKEMYRFPKLVDRGLTFMDEHAKELLAAQNAHHARKELIAAHLGVESWYGDKTGDFVLFNVFLARAQRMQNEKDRRDEYWNLYSLCRIANHFSIDPFEIRGSWGGALGPMQYRPGTLLIKSKLGDFESFEHLNSLPVAIRLVAAYVGNEKALSDWGMKRGGPAYRAAHSYNPKDSHYYPRLIVELADALRSTIRPLEPAGIPKASFLPPGQI